MLRNVSIMKIRFLAIATICFCNGIPAAELAVNSGERNGTATIIHREEVIKNRTPASNAPMRLWPVYSTPESRMNYVEVAGHSAMHFHPDADHKLYVLEGNVVVFSGTNQSTAKPGDLIVIPRGVRHCYDVPAKGDRALLLTFDAPPFDPKKTVTIGN